MKIKIPRDIQQFLQQLAANARKQSNEKYPRLLLWYLCYITQWPHTGTTAPGKHYSSPRTHLSEFSVGEISIFELLRLKATLVPV